jgi:riboflavin kinase/FMN adenylyltransferase
MVVVGANFRFGRAAKGDAATFAGVARELGVEVVVLPLEEHCGVKVSSTRIRRELAAGHVERAAELLGRPFSITATVRSVSDLGTTVRISPELALPAPGLYLGSVVYEGEVRRSVQVAIELRGAEGQERLIELHHLGEARSQGTPDHVCRVVFDRSDPTRTLEAPPCCRQN